MLPTALAVAAALKSPTAGAASASGSERVELSLLPMLAPDAAFPSSSSAAAAGFIDIKNFWTADTIIELEGQAERLSQTIDDCKQRGVDLSCIDRASAPDFEAFAQKHFNCAFITLIEIYDDYQRIQAQLSIMYEKREAERERIKANPIDPVGVWDWTVFLTTYFETSFYSFDLRVKEITQAMIKRLLERYDIQVKDRLTYRTRMSTQALPSFDNSGNSKLIVIDHQSVPDVDSKNALRWAIKRHEEFPGRIPLRIAVILHCISKEFELAQIKINDFKIGDLSMEEHAEAAEAQRHLDRYNQQFKELQATSYTRITQLASVSTDSKSEASLTASAAGSASTLTAAAGSAATLAPQAKTGASNVPDAASAGPTPAAAKPSATASASGSNERVLPTATSEVADGVRRSTQPTGLTTFGYIPAKNKRRAQRGSATATSATQAASDMVQHAPPKRLRADAKLLAAEKAKDVATEGADNASSSGSASSGASSSVTPKRR